MHNCRSWFLSALFTAFGAGSVQAGQVCNAKTHEKYGETRAFFQDVAAGCDNARSCYVVAHVPDDGRGFQYLQQIRVKRAGLSAAPALQFVSVEPMADPSAPFALSIDDQAWDLSPSLKLTDNSANEYRVTDQKLADAIITRMRNARKATWLYRSDKGAPHAARFGLRGAKQAMAWIDCVQAGE